MKTISKEMVRHYRVDRVALRATFIGFTTIFGSFFIWAPSDACGNVLGMALGGGIAFISIIVTAISFYNCDGNASEERGRSNEYALLKRWERCTGKPLSMFPASTIGSKFLERWAINELRNRVRELNFRYSREKDFYDEEQKIDWENLDPRKGEGIKEKRIKREAWMKAHIQAYKRSYLDFWDLITEKDGIGILSGPEWQDPEVFRQKVLAEGDTLIRIGFNAY